MLKRTLFTFVLVLLFSSLMAKSPSVLDVVVIGKDTLIVSTHDFKIMVSYNGGKTWVTTKRELIKHLGVEGKRIWGIDSWIGIHESDYSRLFYSDDFGKTWKKVELNPDIFFAMEFLHVNNKLFIVDAYGGLWQHKQENIESEKSWIKLTSKQPPNIGESIHSATEKSYSFLTRDSLYIYDFKTRRTTSQRFFKSSIQAYCFGDDDKLIAMDNAGNVYEYIISKESYNKVEILKGFEYFSEILFLNKHFYILGSGNDAVKDFVLFSIMTPTYKNEFAKGISGLDQDICFVDKYKRIWCGTTDGLFVLSPNEKSFKQIL